METGKLNHKENGDDGGNGLTGETEQRRFNGEGNSRAIVSWQLFVFSVRPPFLRSSCATVLSVFSVSIFSVSIALLRLAQLAQNGFERVDDLVAADAALRETELQVERQCFRAIAAS